MQSQQTHQRWINVETTSDFNVEFRLDLYSDLKVEIHDVVSTLKDNVDSTLKFWRCFNVKVLTLYQRCFNVETPLFQRWKTTLFQCFNSDVVSTLKHRCITLKMSKTTLKLLSLFSYCFYLIYFTGHMSKVSSTNLLHFSSVLGYIAFWK